MQDTAVARVVPGEGQAANTPRLHAAFDALVGPGRWLPRGSVGTFPIRFPSAADPGDPGWHVDMSFGMEGQADFLESRVNVASRGRALLMLFLFSDVAEADAPTRLRARSHVDVARRLLPRRARALIVAAGAAEPRPRAAAASSRPLVPAGPGRRGALDSGQRSPPYANLGADQNMTTTQIQLTLSLPPRRRRALLAAALGASTALVANAHAEWTAENDPATWVNGGSSVSAAKFKALFAEVDRRIDAVDIGFCGVTTSSYNGAQVAGYDGAADKCAAVNGCGADARMCTPSDLMVFASKGGVFPVDGNAWVSGGLYTVPAGYVVDDCAGWTNSTAMNAAPSWRHSAATSPSGKPDFVLCNETIQIACCD